MNSHTASNTSIRSRIRAMQFIGRPHFRHQPGIPSLSLGLVAALAFGCGAANDGSGDNSGVGASGNSSGVGASGNNSGVGASGNNTGTGIPTGCVIGSQGCICDSVGRCASGLTCESGKCCDSGTGNCSLPATTSAGGGSAGGGSSVSSNGGGNPSGTVCTPGVTGPVITDCGYPYSSSNPLTSVVFNESTDLVGIVPTGGAIATVRLYFNDEHALTLGARRVVNGSTVTDYPVSAMHTVPDSVFYPQVGAPTGLDPEGRPLWPVLGNVPPCVDQGGGGLVGMMMITQPVVAGQCG